MKFKNIHILVIALDIIFLIYIVKTKGFDWVIETFIMLFLAITIFGVLKDMLEKKIGINELEEEEYAG